MLSTAIMRGVWGNGKGRCRQVLSLVDHPMRGCYLDRVAPAPARFARPGCGLAARAEGVASAAPARRRCQAVLATPGQLDRHTLALTSRRWPGSGLRRVLLWLAEV